MQLFYAERGPGWTAISALAIHIFCPRSSHGGVNLTRPAVPSVSRRRTSPKSRSTLMIFLRECSDWLHAHFSGIVTLASLIYFGFLLLTWWNTRQLRKRQQTLQHLVRLRL